MPDRPELLLVEDDELIRSIVAAMLEDRGFGVAEAATGEAALHLIEGGLEPAALVTDIDLGPGIDGLALADRVRALRPGLPVVFVTGRPPALRDRPCRAGETRVFKPFDADTLARAVARSGSPDPAASHRRLGPTTA